MLTENFEVMRLAKKRSEIGRQLIDKDFHFGLIAVFDEAQIFAEA